MSSESSTIAVPGDHVALVLIPEEPESSSFYLQIPLNIIRPLCLKPRKYLLFLGWCILGVEGRLKQDGDVIGTDEDLDDQGVYYYDATEALDLVHAVDLEVIKTRTTVPSESAQARDKFRENLLQRDARCPWTGFEFGEGLYIIPYKRGSDWLHLIVENRPSYNEGVKTLNDINDIRNGVFASHAVYNTFDKRQLVILKTPNQILEPQDIPPHVQRVIADDVSYPPHNRFSVQWLETPSQFVTSVIPNNADATFKKGTKKLKPSGLLLHYNYGVAAVKRWGRGTEILCTRANPPRPPVRVPAPAEPSRIMHNRDEIIRKLAAARNPGGANAKGSKAGGGLVDSEDHVWDEDDVVLFFWGNSRAAKERHLEKVNEKSRRMEQWRQGVPQVSD